MDFRKRKKRLHNKVEYRLRYRHLVDNMDLYIKFLGKYGITMQPESDKDIVCGKLGNGTCFVKSIQLSIKFDNLEYVEGLMTMNNGTHMHGWCYDTKTNQIVDPMCDTKHWGMPIYSGVMFTREYLEKVLPGIHGTVIQNWAQGFPLLYGKFDPATTIIKRKEGGEE